MKLKAAKVLSPGKRRRMSAFTLAEVVISTLVLAISGGAICLGISSGFTFMQTTREDLRATQILMQRLEAVRLCTWSQLSNFRFQESYDPIRGGRRPGGTVYYGRVSLSPAADVPATASYSPNLRLVTVSLSWTNSMGTHPVAHFRQMQTHAARYGLQRYLWGAIQ